MSLGSDIIQPYMKISIICEDSVKHATGSSPLKNCLAEHGFSAFIETGSVKILYDLGHTDLYWRNAEVMGVDLQSTDFIALSHYHWDHTGGLQRHKFTSRKKLILHLEILKKLPTGEAEKIEKDFEIIASKGVNEFAPGAYFLGEIPRVTAFEKGIYKNDPMIDDSAVAIKTPHGVVVVAGCSHSGICNICEYAKKVTGLSLYAVIGGFHLLDGGAGGNVELINGTIDYFKKENPKFIYPMHCVDFSVMARFSEELGVEKLSVGDVVEMA